jgi:hypothetical protein
VNVPWWLLALVGVLALLGMFLRGLAGRVDRLNLRVDAARDALDAQLVRRAVAVAELASSALLDPASALLLAGAAHDAQTASPDEREVAESALSQDLRAVLDDAGGAEELVDDPTGQQLLAELDRAVERVVLSRRFYNESVRMCQQLRRRPLVRLLRLAGRSREPSTFEMDDAPPESVAGTRLPGT